MKIKALTMKQPWASMIASGQKTIETRTWGTRYRGDILITASKKPEGQGPTGCALAIVRLVNCRPMTKEDELAACCEIYPRAVAWELEDIRPLAPFQTKGQMGLWDFSAPDDYIPFMIGLYGESDAS